MPARTVEEFVLMGALLRVIVALMTISCRAACFGPAHEMLPSKVRVTSLGFISMCFAFFSAALVRHVGVAGADIIQLLTGQSLYFGFLLLIAGKKHTAELALYMAASTGVDLIVAGLGVFDLDITTDAVRHPALAWEFLSTAIVITRLQLARRSGGTA